MNGMLMYSFLRTFKNFANYWSGLALAIRCGKVKGGA